MAVVNLLPLKGASLIEINPSIGYAIIDRLLGGAGEYNERYESLLRSKTALSRG